APPTSRRSAWPGSAGTATSRCCGRASRSRSRSDPRRAGARGRHPVPFPSVRWSCPMHPSARQAAFRPFRRGLLALALAVPPAAQAQDAVTLDALEVTAPRKVEHIQDVPISTSGLRGGKLSVFASGAGDVRFPSGPVPSLNIESSFGRAFPRFYIRGLGNTDFDLNASQPVSLVYDDGVQENPILKGFPVFVLDR